jgi:hypothetical protein
MSSLRCYLLRGALSLLLAFVPHLVWAKASAPSAKAKKTIKRKKPILKKPGKPPKTKKLVVVGGPYEAALDRVRPAIEDCILTIVMGAGNASADIKLKLLINNLGQVLGSEVQLKAQRGDPMALTLCIKQALRGAQFPKGPDPLLEIERNYGFAAESQAPSK